MQGEGASGDEQIVRLESDADLVQVITVHKAKGLEYPLVFLPYACTFRPVDKSRTRFLNVAGAEGVRTLHLQLTDELLAAADKDRLREDLRLLYVALTRARHALWLGVMVGVNLQTSFMTPPFGFSLFYLRGVAPSSVTTGQIYRGVVPFVALQVVALGVLMTYPELSTWLPRWVFGR